MERRTRPWTVAEVVTAIAAYQAATGEWPLQIDCCAANGLPSYGAIERLFGSLAEARRQAGMPRDGWVRRPWEVDGRGERAR